MTKAQKRGLAIAAAVVGAIGVVAAFFWPRRSSASSAPGDADVWLTSDVHELLDELFASTPIPLWFAYACAELESGFSPSRYNPERGAVGRTGHNPDTDGSYGVFQIFWHAHQAALEAQGTSRQDLFDPRVNAVYWRALVLRLADQVGASKSDAPSWERVRLRLAGDRDGREDSADDAARIARYRPVAAKWQSRLG